MADSNLHEGAKPTVSPHPLRKTTSCPSSAKLTRRATSNLQLTTRTSTLPHRSSLPLTRHSPSCKDKSSCFSIQAEDAGEGPGEHVGQGTIRLHLDRGQAARQHSPQAYYSPHSERNNLMASENMKLKTRITVLEKEN
jgi:hypothetical protein